MPACVRFVCDYERRSGAAFGKLKKQPTAVIKLMHHKNFLFPFIFYDRLLEQVTSSPNVITLEICLCVCTCSFEKSRVVFFLS